MQNVVLIKVLKNWATAVYVTMDISMQVHPIIPWMKHLKQVTIALMLMNVVLTMEVVIIIVKTQKDLSGS